MTGLLLAVGVFVQPVGNEFVRFEDGGHIALEEFLMEGLVELLAPAETRRLLLDAGADIR